MRVLLLHPEDSPRRGPWSSQPWDLIVDLAKSSAASAASWEELAHAPVLRADSFRQGADDIKQVRNFLSRGFGRLVDDEGIDWWELTSLVIMPEAEVIVVFRRMISEIDRTAELWSTRPGWPASAFACLLQRPLHSFSAPRSYVSTVRRYARLAGQFSLQQIQEIFLDKYDSSYQWRARFAYRPEPLQQPAILVPSAYGNVSRMAAAYATLLPEQSFLFVATRHSGRLSNPVSSMHTRDLAAYAVRDSPVLAEYAAINQKWTKLKADLYTIPEFAALSHAGALDPFPGWFQSGLSARNAWRNLLEREPVCGVLCGDDSNFYTRLPVILAAKRGIPTVDFHHGAMDGRYLLKDLPCFVYLSKNEMERDYLLRVCGLPPEKVVLAAPPSPRHEPVQSFSPGPANIVFFSEPYENAGMRGEEAYREILPRLCRIARETGRRVILKLHPFESVSQRTGMARDLLPDEDFRHVSVIDGPLSQGLLSNAWFGLAVESTAVLDCFLRGVPSFVCGWLTLSPFGYVEQYARFGIAHILRDPKQLAEIPALLAVRGTPRPEKFSKTAEAEALRRCLGIKSRADAVARME